MSKTTILAQQAIVLLQQAIDKLGFKPLVHFELEGTYQFPKQLPHKKLDFEQVNQALAKLAIEAELVPEYWKNQWEYVSKFCQQSPLKEAHNLATAITKLPKIFAKQGVINTFIKPVIWSGDQGKLAAGCDNIFTPNSRAVHIPNAVQINVSALDSNKRNIIPVDFFGEYLQQCFLTTSFECALLYLPEEEAFERLSLKSYYGLAEELCSPSDISGGHQGSIALYKKVGKHNQALGVEPLVLDQNQQILIKHDNWQKTARIEHRLGASSIHYNPYVNVVFALLNLHQALKVYVAGQCQQSLTEPKVPEQLPNSLHDTINGKGAIAIFRESNWFREQLNQIQADNVKQLNALNIELASNIGSELKQSILSDYQQTIL